MQVWSNMKRHPLSTARVASPLAAVALASLLIYGVVPFSGGADASAASLPNDARTVAHVLNRVAFGPRPGDVERVQRIGLGTYIDQQLHPERIDDARIDAQLKTFET